MILIGPVYPYRGGIAQYTTMLNQALSERHAVQVLSFSRQYPGWLYPGKSDKDPAQRMPRAPARYLLDSINPWSWQQTARWVRREKPDLLIFQWWVTFLAPAYFWIAAQCRRAGIPVLFMIHNVLPHEGGGLHPLLAKLALSQGGAFLLHTEVQRSRLLGLLPNARTVVAAFPAYTGFTSQVRLPDAQFARAQLGLPPEAHVLLFFGIVRPYKGLPVLLDALELLHRQGERIHLLVAGEFWEDSGEYQRKIAAAGLVDYVRCENRYIPDEEVGLFFAAADTCVAPYVGGTQSAVVAMAQAYGKPVVMTEISAAGVDLSQFDPRVIVPAGDAPALAQAIRFQRSQPAATSRQADGAESGWQAIVEAIESCVQP